MWRAKPSNRFQRSYNRLSDELADRVDEALETLLSSDRPELIGIRKGARRKGYWSYELGRECRILFRPDYDEELIEFVRVCSHKEVYGP